MEGDAVRVEVEVEVAAVVVAVVDRSLMRSSREALLQPIQALLPMLFGDKNCVTEYKRWW
jgi:hypothetical protein